MLSVKIVKGIQYWLMNVYKKSYPNRGLFIISCRRSIINLAEIATFSTFEYKKFKGAIGI